jgi:hypothetical protein
MGSDLSKEERINKLINLYPNCDFLYELIYNKIKLDESNIYLYALLGKVKYLDEKFKDDSLYYHTSYIETGNETYYIHFLDLLDSFNYEIEHIKNDIINEKYININ